jgi:hypothetical protein
MCLGASQKGQAGFDGRLNGAFPNNDLRDFTTGKSVTWQLQSARSLKPAYDHKE